MGPRDQCPYWKEHHYKYFRLMDVAGHNGINYHDLSENEKLSCRVFKNIVVTGRYEWKGIINCREKGLESIGRLYDRRCEKYALHD